MYIEKWNRIGIEYEMLDILSDHQLSTLVLDRFYNT